MSIVDIGHSILILAFAVGTGLGLFLLNGTQKYHTQGKILVHFCFLAGWIATSFAIVRDPGFQIGANVISEILWILVGGAILNMIPVTLFALPVVIFMISKAWLKTVGPDIR